MSSDAPPDLVALVGVRYESLVRSLRWYSGCAGMAEEIAQEALLRLCRDWERVRELDDPWAWLLRVAFNVANSRFRRAGAERRAYARAASRSLEDVAETALDRLDLRRAVLRLPRRRREVLVLRYYLDLSVAETAAVVGCSANAVSSMTSRSLTLLRQQLGAQEVPRDT